MARELAAVTGESMTQAVVVALRERLAREARRENAIVDRLARLAGDVRLLPVLDQRAADEIISYDERGVPA